MDSLILKNKHLILTDSILLMKPNCQLDAAFVSCLSWVASVP